MTKPHPPGSPAMLVIAGGGYAHIECGKESTPAAVWLTALGFTVFELIYRLPSEGWSARTVPLQDGQRAMRLIRAQAAQFGVNPKRVGIMGFSAGGHLAAMTAVTPSAQRYTAVDAVDEQSARPDFAALLYPVISMQAPLDHTHAQRELLGQNPSAAMCALMSADVQATPAAPPMFLAQAYDDPIAAPGHSLRMAAALHAAKVPVAQHMFSQGRHGWGMGKAGTEVAQWPELFLNWLARSGTLSPV